MNRTTLQGAEFFGNRRLLSTASLPFIQNGMEGRALRMSHQTPLKLQNHVNSQPGSDCHYLHFTCDTNAQANVLISMDSMRHPNNGVACSIDLLKKKKPVSNPKSQSVC